MEMQEFIRENREMLRQSILTACPNCDVADDSDIEDWINNDESLYLWAKSEGVEAWDG